MSTGMAAETERNTAAVRRVFEEGFGQGNLAVIDELVASDTKGHLHDVPAFGQHLKGVITVFRRAFPDLRAEIKHVVAEGDLVACHLALTGTHTGPLDGGLLSGDEETGGPAQGPPALPQTGRRVTLEQMHFVRHENGKGVEHWLVQDTLGFLQQLGVVPPPGARPVPAQA